jgi:hypothetical protein
VQLRDPRPLTSEAYLAQEAWRSASLERCPRHPAGGCGFVRWGTYARKTPAGMRIARWYCPTAHETFSLLPDCLASRFPGELQDLERVVADVDTARSIEAAADVLRPDIELPSAVRWVRRRLTLVRATLIAVVTLLPEVCGHDGRLGAVRTALATDHALVTLRWRAAALLASLPRPLGFARPIRSRAGARRRRQHDLGRDARAPPSEDPARPPDAGKEGRWPTPVSSHYP